MTETELTFDTLPKAIAQLREEMRNGFRLLLEKSKHTQQDLPDLIGIKECALLLGLSVETIYTKVHHRTIPFIKRKGQKKLLFSRKEMLAWQIEGKMPTQAEIKEQAKKSLENNL